MQSVAPAEAGAQVFNMLLKKVHDLDPDFRRDDELGLTLFSN